LIFSGLIVVAGIVLIVLGARTGENKKEKPVPSVNCKNCGSGNPITSEFCNKCGIKNA
jgi:ribosomal protein L40E